MSDPIALTIAGSDCSGGAGIQADLKTMTALGVYGASVLTALTAQNTLGVHAIHPVPVDVVAAQLHAVLDDLRVDAVKIGMLGDTALIETVAEGLSTSTAPIVLDPVMVATSGDVLVPSTAIDAIRDLLVARCRVVTPNLSEAGLLVGSSITTEADMINAGRALLDVGAEAALIKGGHLDRETLVDILVHPQGVEHFRHPRIDTPHTHGTGCTLSSAIAAGLAAGADLTTATRRGIDFVTRAVASGRDRQIGHGRGPVDHVVGIRS